MQPGINIFIYVNLSIDLLNKVRLGYTNIQFRINKNVGIDTRICLNVFESRSYLKKTIQLGIRTVFQNPYHIIIIPKIFQIFA